MPRATFETLPVYQLAEKLSDEIWDIADGWDPFARDTIGQALVQAADRIACDIAIGAGRPNAREKRQFLHATRRALHETRHWLRRAYRRRLLTTAQIERLRPLLDELGLALHTAPPCISTKPPPPVSRHTPERRQRKAPAAQPATEVQVEADTAPIAAPLVAVSSPAISPVETPSPEPLTVPVEADKVEAMHDASEALSAGEEAPAPIPEDPETAVEATPEKAASDGDADDQNP